MAFWQATQCLSPAQPPMTADTSNDGVVAFGDFTIPAGFASGDVVEMVGQPAGYMLVDTIIDNQSLGTTVTSNVGVLTGNYGALLDVAGAARVCDASINSAKALQTAGVVRRDVNTAGLAVPPVADPTTTPRTTGDKGLGFVATTVATPTVGARIRMTAIFRPAIGGI
jgi:hypothetical protein